MSYYRPLYVLGILRGSSPLASSNLGVDPGRPGKLLPGQGRGRGRLDAAYRIGTSGIVEPAHGAAKARAREDRQRGQTDVEDTGVAGGASRLGAAFLGGRNLQADRAVESDLDGVVVRRVRQCPQTYVLEAALATSRYAQSLPATRISYITSFIQKNLL